VFSDPQSVTYATVAKSLPAIGRTDSESTYRLDDNGVKYTLTLSHQYKARNRVAARLRRDSFVSDPLVPANSMLASMTCSFTLDFPNTGLAGSDVQSLGKALVGFLSDANILKLVNGET
jgi:hypothetical protein